MFSIIKKILSLLNKKEKRKLFLLSFAIVLMALVEVAGIASIMPFMAVVGNPGVVETNKWINWVYQAGGFASTDRFLIFLGFFVLFVIIASNAFKATVTWLEFNFLFGMTCNLSRRLFFQYLMQPYAFFLNQNTQLLGKNLLTEVINFVGSVLKPATEIFAKVIVALFIFILLLFVDPLLATIIITTLAVAYVSLYSVVQRNLKHLGEKRFEANAQRFKIAGEALGGIKDLKILGREYYFLNNFSIHAIRMAKTVTFQKTISQIPRFVMEALTFGGILIIVLYLLTIKGNMGQTLPMLALYAFAGYRLMPALQSIFSSVAEIRFNLAAVDALTQSFADKNELTVKNPRQSLPALEFHEEIRLEDISFTYPGQSEPVIRNLNLVIKKNSSVGFVGATGSGKTTTVDIILGLLEPQEGSLMIDGTVITKKITSRWQQNLGYVPQSIFLCDDTVAGNIAFGLPSNEIDMDAIEQASKISNLHNFVVSELEHGYQTNIGERGVRLSGGQRQRIGIARALYHNPKVLIMDEATSALDGITEEAVIQAIRNLSGKKTIITIAHRLNTLKDCDIIYLMDKGRIIEQGAYEELSQFSTRFQAMGRTEITPNEAK